VLRLVSMTTGAIDQHLTEITRQNARPRTIKARANVLRKVEREAGPLHLLGRDDINAWLDRYASASTRATYLGHLRSYFRWACENDVLDRDPTSGIKTPKVPRRLPRPIGEADLADALSSATPHVRAWVTLAAYAGLRACEIAAIRGEHIDRERGSLFIPCQKGGDAASVALAPRVLTELAQWPASGPLWCDHEITANHVSHTVAAHFHSRGIDGGLHRARHRFATRFLEVSGYDLRATQEAMRHRSPASTALYTEVVPERLASIVARIA
jgi:integrase/recombinase XerD